VKQGPRLYWEVIGEGGGLRVRNLVRGRVNVIVMSAWEGRLGREGGKGRIIIHFKTTKEKGGRRGEG